MSKKYQYSTYIFSLKKEPKTFMERLIALFKSKNEDLGEIANSVDSDLEDLFESNDWESIGSISVEGKAIYTFRRLKKQKNIL